GRSRRCARRGRPGPRAPARPRLPADRAPDWPPCPSFRKSAIIRHREGSFKRASGGAFGAGERRAQATRPGAPRGDKLDAPATGVTARLGCEGLRRCACILVLVLGAPAAAPQSLEAAGAAAAD